MIVKAALPLLGEYGAAVTTSRIARAAGIGEATIFRVFTDKEELLDACMAEALRPDHAVRELASIPLDQPLPDRLVEAAEALRAHLERMGSVATALHASGHRRRAGSPDQQVRGMGRAESLASIRSAVGELLEPDRESLRLPPEQIAGVFLGLLFTQLREEEPGLAVHTVVEVFLHGALGGPGESS
ncbi:TetR/AcrR family transcriptional regulator [Streptomyces profundus]|nr:TetR/AcrR family transcriptional regulator [Streptomyces sp. MA3_2.13]